MLWRIAAAAGGAGGLGSLLLPYAYVTGGALGVDVTEGTYTLFQLAQLVEDAGNDPTMIYVLAAVIVVGSVMALIGAFVQHYLAAAGGVVQGGAAVAYWYGINEEGSQEFLAGLGQMDASIEIGFFVLVAASVVAISSILIRAITSALAPRLGSGSTNA